MKTSVWMLGNEYRDGRRVYFAYRLRDKAEPDSAANRETFSRPTERREAAEALIQALNEGAIG